ncbi:hypothetical protein ACFFSW_00725 [Saccharothrix longispora]|uniref:hypothetical protein n=1 Tax=Saccharothrix longispora TaxID=33920 RepID=UPI0031F19A43
MRLRMGSIGVLIVVAALLGFSTTASAVVYQTVSNRFGDMAGWEPVGNRMLVCDNSRQNGTAVGILEVIGGNTHVLIDGNGAPDPCEYRGFNVDDSKRANLWVCTNSTRNDCSIRYNITV